MTEKTVWETYYRGIKQSRPAMIADIVCHRPLDGLASLAEWPERARLICAAPDLLAACERVLAWRDAADRFSSWHNETQPMVEAAVAKAKGAPVAHELDCETCESTGHTPDEPAPAPVLGSAQDSPVGRLKTWWISADDGEVLRLNAERVEEYDGGLALCTGENVVACVAAGRWIAYWEDGAGSSFGD